MTFEEVMALLATPKQPTAGPPPLPQQLPIVQPALKDIASQHANSLWEAVQYLERVRSGQEAVHDLSGRPSEAAIGWGLERALGNAAPQAARGLGGWVRPEGRAPAVAAAPSPPLGSNFRPELLPNAPPRDQILQMPSVDQKEILGLANYGEVTPSDLQYIMEFGDKGLRDKVLEKQVAWDAKTLDVPPELAPLQKQYEDLLAALGPLPKAKGPVRPVPDSLIVPGMEDMGPTHKDIVKEFYKGTIEASAVLTPEEKAQIKMYWPELLDQYIADKPKPIVPEPAVGPANWDDWEAPVVDRRAARMEYEDQFVGPPVPRRNLPDEPSAKVARMRELGFDPDRILYSGVPQWGQISPLGFKDPRTQGKGDEVGIFLTDQPRIAESYAQSKGTVLPLKVRMQNPLEVDWTERVGTDSYSRIMMNQLIDEALRKGHDSLILRDMYDMGGKQDQYVVFEPSQLRVPWAKFDPQNAMSKDLLASLAAAFGLGGLALGQQQEPKR